MVREDREAILEGGGLFLSIALFSHVCNAGSLTDGSILRLLHVAKSELVPSSKIKSNATKRPTAPISVFVQKTNRDKGDDPPDHLVLKPFGMIPPVLRVAGPARRRLTPFNRISIFGDRVVNSAVQYAEATIAEIGVIHFRPFNHPRVQLSWGAEGNGAPSNLYHASRPGICVWLIAVRFGRAPKRPRTRLLHSGFLRKQQADARADPNQQRERSQHEKHVFVLTQNRS